MDKRKDQLGFISIPVLVLSLYMFFSRMSNLIYFLPKTYLTMWLLTGSHLAISRQTQYYLSEPTWAGLKRSPKIKLSAKPYTA